MISVDPAGDVRVVRLHHGKVNALDAELLDEVAATFDRLRPSPIVLTGNGRVFSAGADLSRVLDGGADYAARFVPALSRAFVAVFSFPGPVVAAIDGAAIAGGCVLAAACDHRVMARGRAVIGASELAVGVPFPVAAIEVLRHAWGPTTGELVLRAQLLGPDDALAQGMVDELADPDDVLARAIEVATATGAFPGEAYAMTKRHLRADSLARIERETPTVDQDVARVWASEATRARIREQMERLRKP
jgi:enoyl-CoA hydratase/carnithine racemase